MQKVTFILLALLLFTGCSVRRKSMGHSVMVREKVSSESLPSSVSRKNLTSSAFFIEKAGFRIVNGSSEKSGIATCKFTPPDKYLISLKSNAGIEFVRIYSGEDSVKVIDRIHKKLYIGSEEYVKGRFGISSGLLPVLLGDLVYDRIKNDSVNCRQGLAILEAFTGKTEIEFQVDCEKGKVIKALPSMNEGGLGIELIYRNFITVNEKVVPGYIKLYDSHSNSYIEFEIEKIIIPWDGSIEFLQGKQYEVIYLL